MSEINIYAIGVTEVEMKLLNGIVHLSKRRDPKLSLLSDNEKDKANVILVNADTTDISTLTLDIRQLIANKPVTWINKKDAPEHHLSVIHPFQWSRLPLYLTQSINRFNNFKKQTNNNQINVKSSSSVSTQQLQTSSNNINIHQNNTQNIQSHTQNINKDIPTSLKNDTNANNSVNRPVIKDSSNRDIKSFDSGKILVVDDSKVVREYLYKILLNEGYQVSVAADGGDAIRMFRPNYFDLVLMDVVMPDVDGYVACRKIKASELSNKTPVVMLTSKSSPFDKIRGKMAGCDSYLTKPVEMSDLMNVIEKYVN